MKINQNKKIQINLLSKDFLLRATLSEVQLQKILQILLISLILRTQLKVRMNLSNQNVLMTIITRFMRTFSESKLW